MAEVHYDDIVSVQFRQRVLVIDRLERDVRVTFKVRNHGSSHDTIITLSMIQDGL